MYSDQILVEDIELTEDGYIKEEDRAVIAKELEDRA